MDDVILNRIKKVRELTLRGSEGEKTAATILFDQLLQKYHLEDYNFDEEEEKAFIFTYHNATEQKILIQVFCKVTNSEQLYELRDDNTGNLLPNQLRGYCTDSQKVQIDFLVDFYMTLWQEEVELFLQAFILKHELYRDTSNEEHESPFDKDTLDRIFKMTEVLKELQPILRIEK